MRVVGGVKAAGIESIISTAVTLPEEKQACEDELVQYEISTRRTEKHYMNDELKKAETQNSAIGDIQSMDEKLLFKGGFDMTRFETSVFD